MSGVVDAASQARAQTASRFATGQTGAEGTGEQGAPHSLFVYVSGRDELTHPEGGPVPLRNFVFMGVRMPRPNKLRSIGGEENLARRIANERKRRGLSYEALATKMTDAGCAIQPSAIYKIEKSDPPRRITVNELVAFAHVFAVSVENLLRPIEVLELERAREILEELDKVDSDWLNDVARTLDLYAEFYALEVFNPELADYIQAHRRKWMDEDYLKRAAPLLDRLDASGAPAGPFLDALAQFWRLLHREAQRMADARLRRAFPDVAKTLPAPPSDAQPLSDPYVPGATPPF